MKFKNVYVMFTSKFHVVHLTFTGKFHVICSWRINHSRTWRRCVNLFTPRIWLTVCGLAPCCVRYTIRPSTTGGTRPATWCWCLISRTPSSTRMYPLRYVAASYATPEIKMSNGIFLCAQDELFFGNLDRCQVI